MMSQRPEVLPIEIRSIAALLMVMLLARLGSDVLPRQLPFIAALDAFGSPEQWVAGWKAVYLFGAALILTGLAIRTGCLLAGMALAAKVFGSMPLFSNGRFFDAMILLLIGLYSPRWGLSILRAQCLMIYVGAVMSKLIDADWWNGRFIVAILDYHLPERLRLLTQPLAPLLGWVTIVAEACCAIFLSLPRLRWAGVVTVLTFHTALLVLLNEDFGSFYYSVAIVPTLLFVRLPRVEAVSAPPPVGRLAAYAVFTPLREARPEAGPFLLRFAGFEYVGAAAAFLFLFTSLPVLASTIVAAALLGRVGYGRARDVILAVTVALGLVVWRARRERSRIGACALAADVSV